MGIFQILELLIAFAGAEMPLFLLLLHMQSRIVKLETMIDILVTKMPKRRGEYHESE